MANELVSIITPAFNCERYIGETIESVQKQSYCQWELIIVDDCSADNTVKVIKEYMENDNRIKCICLKENSGTAIARNKAIEIAKGDYIAFLDSDDIWLEEKLKIQIEYMKNNNYSITCTSYEQIDDEGKTLNNVIKSVPKADYNRILLDCPVGNSSVMYNVKELGKIYVPNIRKRNDDALWLKILKKEKYIFGIDNVLMRYRVRADSISSNKFALVKYHWILYRQIEKLSIPKSIFHIIYWGFIKIFKIKK
mgnify:CR=1 FL=1